MCVRRITHIHIHIHMCARCIDFVFVSTKFIHTMNITYIYILCLFRRTTPLHLGITGLQYVLSIIMYISQYKVKIDNS